MAWRFAYGAVGPAHPPRARARGAPPVWSRTGPFAHLGAAGAPQARGALPNDFLAISLPSTRGAGALARCAHGPARSASLCNGDASSRIEAIKRNHRWSLQPNATIQLQPNQIKRAQRAINSSAVCCNGLFGCTNRDRDMAEPWHGASPMARSARRIPHGRERVARRQCGRAPAHLPTSGRQDRRRRVAPYPTTLSRSRCRPRGGPARWLVAHLARRVLLLFVTGMHCRASTPSKAITDVRCSRTPPFSCSRTK